MSMSIENFYSTLSPASNLMLYISESVVIGQEKITTKLIQLRLKSLQ